jgi:hypothetical protein
MTKPSSSNDTSSSSEGNDPEATSLKAAIEVLAMRSEDELTSNQSPLAPPAGDSVAADIESGSPPNTVPSYVLRERIYGKRESDCDCDCDDLQSHPRRYAICFAIFLVFFIVMIIVFRSICDGDECDRNP